MAALFFTCLVCEWRTLPTLTFFSGHSPNQDANADALLKRETSGPISTMIVCAVRVLSPGTSVRSTPAIRYSSDFRSNAGSLPARWYRRSFVPEGRFGWAFADAALLASIFRSPCLRLPLGPCKTCWRPETAAR